MCLVADPIGKENLQFYPAAHTSGGRSTSAIKWVIIHSTEGSTASGAAGWFRNPQSSASTQLVVDNDFCFRCVRDDVIPWAAPGANTKGLHIEHAGFAKWNWAQWMLRRKMLQRSAYHIAKWCFKYNIPVVWLSPADLAAGKRGISSHANCSKGLGGGDHWDPGSSFPVKYLLSQVQKNLDALKQV